MGQIDKNEIAALNERFESDDWQESPARRQFADVAAVAGPAVAAGTAIVASGGAVGTGLAILGGVVAGLNLLDRLLQLGGSTVKENVREVAEAVEAGLTRLEQKCNENGKGLDELRTCLNSDEFTEATAILVLHSLRTKNRKRLNRLAQVLVNGVAADDLEPESLDDLMRAAIELTEWDIVVLKKMYESQKHLLTGRRNSFDWSEQVGTVWEQWNIIFGLNDDQHLKLRPSLSRLQSLGMIAEAQTNFVKDGSLARQAFGLLQEGKNFYERLQEISIKS